MFLLMLSGCTTQNENGDDMVSNPETAIAIARAVLNERFSEHFTKENPFDNFDFTVESSGGVWIVRNVMDSPVTVDSDGTVTLNLGGNYSVHIRKSNGEILRATTG